MSTSTAVMTTREVADRFHQLGQEGKWDQVQAELYADEAVSIEPEHTPGPHRVEGKEGIKQKGEKFQQMTEEFHGGFTNEPIVAGNFFAVAMGMDATMKGMGRMKMEEIALYEVKDGKIVREQFFF